MSESGGGGGSAIERWDRLLRAMSAAPRREVIVSLLGVPDERQVPLPDAAVSPRTTTDSSELVVQLHHHHLPLLEDEGYVRWEADPFCVRRGPNFEEAAAFMRVVFEGVDELPPELIRGCPALERAAKRG